MTRERDDEPRKAVRPTSQPGPTPDDVNDDPTEAERLLRALHGVTWEGEPVGAAIERVITQAQRDALTAAAEDLDTLLRVAATRLGRKHQPAVPDWLRKRAERL